MSALKDVRNLVLYKQTRELLRDDIGFCYLGVLADQSTVGEWMQDVRGHWYYTIDAEFASDGCLDGRFVSDNELPEQCQQEWGIAGRMTVGSLERVRRDTYRIVNTTCDVSTFIVRHNDAGFSFKFCDILRRTYGGK